MQILVEIDFDSGTRYFSREGVRAPSNFYEPLVASFGGTKREVSLVPSEYRASQASITLNNAGGEFSRLRAAESWRNRLLRVRLVDPETQGFGDSVIAFVGRISRWTLNAQTCQIDAVDAVQQRLRTPLKHVLDSGFFHRMPDETPRALIPLVVGDVSAPLGAVPAYLVEPSVDVVPWVYVACQGRGREITEVYAYGALVDPGDYSINYISGPAGTVVTAIEFDADPRTGHETDPLNPHVAWNGSGITDDDTETGNPVNNGAEQLVKVLRLHGFDPDEIDATTVAQAANALNAQGIVGAFVAVDRELTIGDIVRQFAESYNLQLFTTSEGLIGMTAPVTTVDEEAELPEVTALADVVDGSFDAQGPDDVAATLAADYEFNWYANGFLSHLERTNAHQITDLGEDIALASQHPFIRDSASMTAVADAKLFFLREGRQVVRVLVPPHWHGDLEIGDQVRLTHFAGVGQAGYDRQIFEVIGMGLVPVGASLAVELTLVDLTAEPVLSVHQSDFSLQPYVMSDYFRPASIARGRLRFGASVMDEEAESPALVAIAGESFVTAHLRVAKKLLPDAIAGASSVVASLTVEDIVQSGLVGEWRFDEGSGSTLGDSKGSADGSINGASWVTEGLSFDGGDYVTIPFVLDPANDFSLVLVFRFSDTGGIETLWTQQDGTGSGRASLQTENINDRMQTNLGGPPPMDLVTALTNGNWYMGTVKKAGTTLSLHLNGGAPTSAIKTVLSATGQHVIGIAKDLAGNGFTGRMAYALLYSRTLSTAEVAQNYAALKTKILPGRGISL